MHHPMIRHMLEQSAVAAGSSHRVLTVTEAQRYEQAQAAYEAMQSASSPSTMQREIEVGGYTRKHQTPAGNIVQQSVEQHTRSKAIRR